MPTFKFYRDGAEVGISGGGGGGGGRLIISG